MLPYAAYLRVYEPLSAFEEPELSRWVAYAASPHRPRRREALEAEYADALRRVAALPPIVVPDKESEHAYVRWADGVIYICPWQTRLRSWLALGQLRATARPPLADAFSSPSQAAEAARAFATTYGDGTSLRTYIQTSAWSVPLTWFAMFSPAERWLALGPGDEAGARSSATTSAVRTLIYATAMTQARRRSTATKSLTPISGLFG